MIDYTLPLDQLPDPLPIEPLRKPFDVTITPPGSKSITCRAYVLAALAKGESKIIRPLRADDPDYLLQALCTLGVEARWVPGEDHDGEDVYIKGVGGRFPRGGNLYMGDGGAPTRFMIACACLAAEPVVIDASARMRERPIAEGVEMLRQLGAKIEYVEEEGRLPVRMVPSEQFVGGSVKAGRMQSSQSLSALILIGSLLQKGLHLILNGTPTSSSYLRLTEHVVAQWRRDSAPPQGEGSPTRQFWSSLDELSWSELRVMPSMLCAQECMIESDASGAAYWFISAWLSPPSRVKVCQFGARPIQPDLRVLLELRSANLADLTLSMQHRYDAYFWELSRGRKTGKLKCDCALYPDGAVALVVGASMMKNRSRFTGLGTLRVKETDRITALANELRKVGCTVETGEDWIEITPPKDPPAEPGAKGIDHKSVVIETYNDHRMAMAFAVLGLVRPGISIRNPACVSKSYPGFWKDFAKLYQ